jgi:hypothetical protein
VLVQREMERGRSPIVSIARAAAGADRNCNWLQKGLRLEVNNMPKSLRSIMAGLDASGSYSKRKANWLRRDES